MVDEPELVIVMLIVLGEVFHEFTQMFSTAGGWLGITPRDSIHTATAMLTTIAIATIMIVATTGLKALLFNFFRIVHPHETEKKGLRFTPSFLGSVFFFGRVDDCVSTFIVVYANQGHGSFSS